MKKSMVLIFILLFASKLYAQNIEIKISSPEFNHKVDRRTLVEGQVNNPKSDVWVVIHPMLLNTYYVQPKINVNSDGRWGVMAYFGETSTQVGTPFEVFALANPKDELFEGMQFTDLPQAESISDYVRVYRK